VCKVLGTSAAFIDPWRQLDFCCKISTVSLFAVECTEIIAWVQKKVGNAVTDT